MFPTKLSPKLCKTGPRLSLANNRAESEFFVGSLCGRVFGLPTQVALQKTFAPAFFADSAWLPANADLDNKHVFFCFRVDSFPDAEKLAQHITNQPLVRSVQFTEVAKKPVKMIAVHVVGLPLFLEQEQADTFVNSLNLTADTMHFRVYTSIGRRGTARVFMPISLLPLLHAMPFKTAGTKFLKADKAKDSWQWCTRCWTQKPNGSGNCQHCQIRCSRCGGEHLLRSCDQQRGSCKHCKHIGKSDEECATHIISSCRLLRETLKPLLLPVPSKELLAKYPHLKDSLPRKLLVRDVEPVVKQIPFKAPQAARSYAEAAAAGGSEADSASLREELKQLAKTCSDQAQAIKLLTEQVAQLQGLVRGLQASGNQQRPLQPLPVQPMPSLADLQAAFHQPPPAHQLLDEDFPPLAAEQQQRQPQPISKFSSGVDDDCDDDDTIDMSQRLEEAEEKEAQSQAAGAKRGIDKIADKAAIKVTPEAKRHMNGSRDITVASSAVSSATAFGADSRSVHGRPRKAAQPASSSTSSGAIAPTRK